MWRKACPRCHGDLVIERTYDGKDVSCLQCGFILPDRMAVLLLTARLPAPQMGHGPREQTVVAA